MLTNLTTISSTMSGLSLLGVDDDKTSTIGSILTTSLTAGPYHVDIHHHYSYADNYINSLSDEQLASLEAKLEGTTIENKNENIKQLVIR